MLIGTIVEFTVGDANSIYKVISYSYKFLNCFLKNIFLHSYAEHVALYFNLKFCRRDSAMKL